jgi:hypothetical protein
VLAGSWARTAAGCRRRTDRPRAAPSSGTRSHPSAAGDLVGRDLAAVQGARSGSPTAAPRRGAACRPRGRRGRGRRARLATELGGELRERSRVAVGQPDQQRRVGGVGEPADDLERARCAGAGVGVSGRPGRSRRPAASPVIGTAVAVAVGGRAHVGTVQAVGRPHSSHRGRPCPTTSSAWAASRRAWSGRARCAPRDRVVVLRPRRAARRTRARTPLVRVEPERDAPTRHNGSIGSRSSMAPGPSRSRGVVDPGEQLGQQLAEPLDLGLLQLQGHAARLVLGLDEEGPVARGRRCSRRSRGAGR